MLVELQAQELSGFTPALIGAIMAMQEQARPQKITFAEMRSSGVRSLLIYCADYHCSHCVEISGDRWPMMFASSILSLGLSAAPAVCVAAMSVRIGTRESSRQVFDVPRWEPSTCLRRWGAGRKLSPSRGSEAVALISQRLRDRLSLVEKFVMRISPPTAPHGPGKDTYIVLDDFGARLGRAWRETDEDAADRETVIDRLLAGEFSNPIRIIAFNTAEGWSRDMTANELLRLCAERDEVPQAIADFIFQYTQ